MLKLFCCLASNPFNEEDVKDLDINVNIKVDNVCCIAKPDLIRQVSPSFIRRGRKTNNCEWAASGRGGNMDEITVGAHYTNQDVIILNGANI